MRNGQVAVAPVSGFHHAGYDLAGGYCTFNGLMVAAALLRERAWPQRVGILDLDQHYGNGTRTSSTRSSARWVQPLHRRSIRLPPRRRESFLRAAGVAGRLLRLRVLLYQAGADPHVDDPLGGWMTTEQLMKRDRIVFREARQVGLPVAWNLAGGYQRDADGGIGPVLAIHRNTMRACIVLSSAVMRLARAPRARGRRQTSRRTWIRRRETGHDGTGVQPA